MWLLDSAELAAYLEHSDVDVPQRLILPPPTFAHLLEDSELGDAVERELGNLQPADPNSVMVCCFKVSSAVERLDLPLDLESELRLRYQQLCLRSEAAEVQLTVGPLYEQARHRVQGEEALIGSVKKCYGEYLSTTIMAEPSATIGQLVKGAPGLVIQRSLNARCSGVVLTLDPVSGAPEFVVIYSAWGLADDILRKKLGRDEYLLHKPTLQQGHNALVGRYCGHKEFLYAYDLSSHRMCHRSVDPSRIRSYTLNKEEALTLARAALALEQRLGGPISLDWGQEEPGRRLVVTGYQAKKSPAPNPLTLFRLDAHGPCRLRGKAVGHSVAVGRVRVIEGPTQLDEFRDGEVLVASKTEPDWEPFFKRAAALVTELDTRVSHSTILAREMGIPAVLSADGCTDVLNDGDLVTVSCCQGKVGAVYEGEAQVYPEQYHLDKLPDLDCSLMVSLSMPERALAEGLRPWAGAGLVRSEFLLTGWVKIHPLALLNPSCLTPQERGVVDRLCRGYDSKTEYFLDRMSMGIGTIASAFWPRPVTLRLSDLKSNEYAKLVAGSRFEPAEHNPMLGWRGASRYYHGEYREAFALELEAVRRVRQEMGLHNLHVMLPFLRTPDEAATVLRLLEGGGLQSGQDGLQLWMMAEVPSNVFLADEFAAMFDGLSIGGNDLTQLTLGVDRDCKRVAPIFDDQHPAMIKAYKKVIEAAHRAGKPVGFCGQAVSDDPIFATTLVDLGIDSLSISPDALVDTLTALRG